MSYSERWICVYQIMLRTQICLNEQKTIYRHQKKVLKML